MRSNFWLDSIVYVYNNLKKTTTLSSIANSRISVNDCSHLLLDATNFESYKHETGWQFGLEGKE